MVFAVLEAVEPHADWIVLTSALVHAPFYFYVSYAMIRYLFHDDRVTQRRAVRDRSRVHGRGLCLRLRLRRGAGDLARLVRRREHGDQPWFNLLFLSFTNLTSVGLSDVLPIGEHARSLVMVEQVVGRLYVALVIARLVGLTVVPRPGARATDRSLLERLAEELADQPAASGSGRGGGRVRVQVDHGGEEVIDLGLVVAVLEPDGLSGCGGRGRASGLPPRAPRRS